MGVVWSEVGLTSHVVVIDDYIVWAVGEAPKVECDARHQGHCETEMELGNDIADRLARSGDHYGQNQSDGAYEAVIE